MKIGDIHGEFTIISEPYKKDVISKSGKKRRDHLIDVQCTKCGLKKALKVYSVEHNIHQFCWCETLKERRRIALSKIEIKHPNHGSTKFASLADEFMKELREKVKSQEERKKLIRV